MRLLLAAAILALCAPTSFAQDKEKKKPKDGADAPAGKEERGPKDEKKGGKAPCGKGPHQIAEEMKKNGLGGEDLEDIVAKHFKEKHPGAPCHCTCGHDEKDEPGAPKPPPVKEPPRDGGVKPPPVKDGARDGDGCGKTAKQLLQSGKVDEYKVAEHFKKHHPKGDACHCTCGHEAGEKGGDKPHGKGEKGNNGVGNGEDPQPPGKAPLNDGPGDKPGAPGRKGGEKGEKR